MIIHVDKIRFYKNRLNYVKYKLGSPSKITRDNVFLFKHYNPGLLSTNIAKLTVKNVTIGLFKINLMLVLPQTKSDPTMLSHTYSDTHNWEVSWLASIEKHDAYFGGNLLTYFIF